MRNIEAPVEDIGAPEDDIGLANDIVLLDPFERPRLKPDEVQDAASVGEMSDEAALAAVALLLEAEELAAHLYKRHIGRKLVNVVQPSTVDMLIREVVKEVAERGDTQFRVQ